MKSLPARFNLIALKTFAAYLLLSILLLLLPAHWTGPVRHAVLLPLTIVQGGLRRALLAAERAGRSLTRSWREDAEFGQLRDRVTELEARLAAERAKRKAAEARLALIHHLPPEKRTRALLASAMSHDPSALRRTVRFDKGSRHGVVRNAVLQWKDLLVGRIETVGPWSCDAVLVGDRDCAVGVRCARSNVQGVLTGLGKRLSPVKYIPAPADVRAGDIFITSGTDGIFPEGRLVGACTEASSASGATFKWVVVKPAFDLSRLEDVVILLPDQAADGRAE